MTAPASTAIDPTVADGPDPDPPPPPFDLRAYLRTTCLQLAAFFVLYTLSIGPMYWRWYASMYLNGPEYIARIYYPLYLLSAFRPFGEFLNWYVDLWIG
jgi:hypothetical protein